MYIIMCMCCFFKLKSKLNLNFCILHIAHCLRFNFSSYICIDF